MKAELIKDGKVVYSHTFDVPADRDHYSYFYPLMGQAFSTAYNSDQNCNELSTTDPDTGVMRRVDHYIIDEAVKSDLLDEIKNKVPSR